MEKIEYITIKKIIILSLQELILNDKEIFSIEPTVIEFKDVQRGTNDRLAHETAINHRFAIYLEQNLNKYAYNSNYYQVDIEYNRWFGLPKELNGDNIRPDILVHKRQGDNLKIDNLLIVEAKKTIISNEDEGVIKKIMKNKKYLYQYGLTVVYCGKKDTKILCNLYYKDKKNHIQKDEFHIKKHN